MKGGFPVTVCEHESIAFGEPIAQPERWINGRLKNGN